MYRALHPEDSTVTAEDCKLLTLQTVLVDGIYNDFGMLVRDKVIVLMEAQSTFTKNLAVRILLYYAETVARYVESNELNLYSARKVKIPRPEFYVVYVGPKEDIPSTICLSELFEDRQESETYIKEHGGLDLTVKVIRKTGKGDILDQYVRFCEISNDMREIYGNSMDAVRSTIEQCLKEDVLVEFLSSRREEVQETMMSLYDEEIISKNYEREIWKDGEQSGIEKGIEQGIEQGIEKGIEKGIQSLVKAMKGFSQSRENMIDYVAREFGLEPQAAEEKVSLYW